MVSVIGTWKIFVDWNCNGSYANTTITFNNNGTFSSPSGAGKWSQHDGKIIWAFGETPNAVYGGDLVDAAMVGIMSNFTNSQSGCWYAVSASATDTCEPEFDAAGKSRH